jgi:hypothetical protein
MINLDHYITGLQAAWIKKIFGKVTDNWRRDLFLATGGNLLIADPDLVKNLGALILKEICGSHREIRKAFYLTDNFLLSAHVLFNPALSGFERAGSVFSILKRNIPNIGLERMAELKICDFWEIGAGMKRLDEICENTGILFSLATYMRLGAIITPVCRRLDGDIRPANLTSHMLGPKKGSKKIQEILSNFETKKKNDIRNLRQVKTFFGLIGVPVPDTKLVKYCFSMWDCRYGLPVH